MTKYTPRILVIDDDKSFLGQVPTIFEDECQVDGFPTIDQGLLSIESQFYDIIILDLNFDGDNRTGLDVFRKIHAIDSGASVIFVSAEPNQERVIEVLNAGVTRFITKPASIAIIRDTVRKVLEEREMKRRALSYLGDEGENPLIGNSLPMQKAKSEADLVLKGSIQNILIQGETGTGKDVMAKFIARTADPSERLVSINCAGLSESLVESELFGHMKGSFTGADRDRLSPFEVAGGGFVFLDEIGDMPLSQQAKLLRVLQERKIKRVGSDNEIPVSFKVIAATNVNIDESVAKGKFRSDLLYRIATHRINLPALRDRPEDIPELVHYFLAQTPKQRRKDISQDALMLLQNFSWPGNVRQLKTIIENAEIRAADGVIRDKEICQALPELAKINRAQLSALPIGHYNKSLIINERRRFEKALIQANNNREDAAKILGISRASFFRKAKDLGLVKDRKPKGVTL
jgi:DNA-binding NtrC family response regulator